MWLVVVLFLLKSGVFALSHVLQEKIRCELSGRDKTINSALKMLINQGSRGFFVKFIFSIAWSSMKLRV